jgi:hypothetical protein
LGWINQEQQYKRRRAAGVPVSTVVVTSESATNIVKIHEPEKDEPVKNGEEYGEKTDVEYGEKHEENGGMVDDEKNGSMDDEENGGVDEENYL